MKQFLTPFNIKFYNAIEAYKELSEIDWTIRAKMEVDDEVYFYCSAPVKKILMKGIVTAINVEFEDMINDNKFYRNESDIKNNNGMKYTRIKLTEVFGEEKSNLLTFDLLKENGLKGVVQSTRIIDRNNELSSYINKIN